MAELQARRYLKRCLQFEVEVGIMQPISDAEAKKSVRNGLNVRMAHFPKLGKQRYDFAGHPLNWKQK